MLKAKIAVMVSGGGTNLEQLIKAQKSGLLADAEISIVIADNDKAYALQRAAKANIAAVVVDKNAADFEQQTNSILAENEIDLIVLAGFLTILSADFTRKWENKIINVHPSLIPSFCGKGFYGLKVHQAALAAGVKVTGATVHFVDEITDGGKIIMQKAVEIKPDDTAETLQRRVMEEAEWVLLPQAVQLLAKEIVKNKAQ